MADNLVKILCEEGWHLRKEWISKIIENLDHHRKQAPTPKNITDQAINLDFAEIGDKYLQDRVSSSKDSILLGPCVLQIGKIRNVSAPKDNEGSTFAPRMLKLSLTDGNFTCSAIEFERIEQISLQTAPGTKVKLIGSIPMTSGLLKLQSSSVKVLGGRVEKLYTKWQLSKESIGFSRSGIVVEGAPPPFIAFGKKSQGTTNSNRVSVGNKSLKNNAKGEEENTEFKEQRQAAIAEVSKVTAVGKKFDTESKPTFDKRPYNEAGARKGAGPKNQFQAPPRNTGMYRELSTESGENVHQKTVNEFVGMGFKREDVVLCLRKSNNDFEKTMDLLVEMSDDGRTYESHSTKNYDNDGRGGRRGSRRGGARGRGRGRARYVKDGENSEALASTSATLFDFLESKMSSVSVADGWQSNNAALYENPAAEHENHHRDLQHHNNIHRETKTTTFGQFDRRQDEGRKGNRGNRGRQRGNGRYDHGHGRIYGRGRARNGIYNEERQKYSRGNNSQMDRERCDADRGDGVDHTDKTHESSCGEETWQGDARHGKYGEESRVSGGRNDTTFGNTYKNKHENRGARRGRNYENIGDGRGGKYENNRRRHEHNGKNKEHERPPRFSKADTGQQKQRHNNVLPSGDYSKAEKHKTGDYIRRRNDLTNNHPQTENNSGASGFSKSSKSGKDGLPLSIPPFPNFTENPLPSRGPPTTFGVPVTETRSEEIKLHKNRESVHAKPPPLMPSFDLPNTQISVILPQWQKGSQCLARYWEDSRFYEAVVQDLHPTAPTAVVWFTDFGNYEEVELFNLKPLPSMSAADQGFSSWPQGATDFVGSTEKRHQRPTPAFQEGRSHNQRRTVHVEKPQKPAMALYVPPAHRGTQQQHS